MKEFEFELPDYIRQEIEEYIKDINEGRARTGKLLNIRTLLRLAMMNKKLTYEQVLMIEKRITDIGKI